jgi:hypothetical protein
MKFRQLSTKLASASALPSRHDRRHSLAQTRTPVSHRHQRNYSDPFIHFRSAPPQQAPWHTPDDQSQPSRDNFSHPNVVHRVQRSVSSVSITSIPEEDADEVQTPGPKSSPFLRPPEQTYGSHRISTRPTLHVDTSDGTLVSSPGLVSREGPVPGSPFAFRDMQETRSINSSLYRRTYKYWPFFLLPEPHFLYITLFPTLIGFESKPWFHKLLSIIAIPAVFCLTITLPVVDTESTEVEGEIRLPSGLISPGVLVSPGPDGSSEIIPLSPLDESILVARIWNRWLTGVQCIFAPLFMTFIFFRMLFPFIADIRG